MNDIVDGIVYFADKSSLKPKRIGSIRLKLPGFPDFVLHNVFYLLDLHRNPIVFSEHSITTTFHPYLQWNIEIRKSFDNKVIMTGMCWVYLLTT